jgi:hypothetical protein
VYAVYLRDVVVKDDDGLWSYSRIGRLFGRSHSTMFLNCKRQRCFLQAGDRMTVLLWNVLVHAAGRDDLHRQAKLC